VIASPVRHEFTAFGGSLCEITALDASHAEVSAMVAEVYAFEAQHPRERQGR
jgi:hypothetical protein